MLLITFFFFLMMEIFPVSCHYLPIYDNRGGGGWSDAGIQPIYLYVAALHHCQQLPLTCIK